MISYQWVIAVNENVDAKVYLRWLYPTRLETKCMRDRKRELVHSYLDRFFEYYEFYARIFAIAAVPGMATCTPPKIDTCRSISIRICNSDTKLASYTRVHVAHGIVA